MPPAPSASVPRNSSTTGAVCSALPPASTTGRCGPTRARSRIWCSFRTFPGYNVPMKTKIVQSSDPNSRTYHARYPLDSTAKLPDGTAKGYPIHGEAHAQALELTGVSDAGQPGRYEIRITKGECFEWAEVEPAVLELISRWAPENQGAGAISASLRTIASSNSLPSSS